MYYTLLHIQTKWEEKQKTVQESALHFLYLYSKSYAGQDTNTIN